MKRNILALLLSLCVSSIYAQTYSFTMSTDCPSGVCNTAKLDAAIRASAIVSALDYINTGNDTMDIVFKEDLSSEDETILHGDTTDPAGGLIASHDTSATQSLIVTKLAFTTDDHRTIIDGHQTTIGTDTWDRQDYALPGNYHLQGTRLAWSATEVGDYVNLAILHQSSENSLASPASSGTTEVDVGAYSAYYDPANGAEYLEVWDASNAVPQEIHAIDRLVGDVVHLKTTLIDDLETDEKIWACHGTFSPIRGTDGLAGGYFMLKEGTFVIRNQHSMTPVLPTGRILSSRVRTVAAGATRSFVCNYVFREHLATDVDH